ncbi:MAG: N-acetylmuramoyl-L-alanine amidase [Alphaproteobacteria bacterium]|nr:N-acetylmuramoyl-L-alanine amidase [Alphaproteobacteria bacterium]
MRRFDSPSPNHDERPDGTPIDMLVIHYTGMKSATEALARLADPAAKVSAHYLIDEDGSIHALVPEERRAWHAGLAFWRDQRDINARSIGIELVNPGHEFGYRGFPEAQMKALINLATKILSRHPIAPRNVVGHADVAPTRKQDPGEFFDWKRLADCGIGLWPSSAQPGQAVHLIPRLHRYGYDISDPDAAVLAFQRHFRPAKTDGIADAECAGLLDALLLLVQE